VQVSWLGYPGSCPAPWYDYAVVDPIVVPPAEREWLAERRIVVPDSYMPCRRIAPLAPPPLRGELGLPEGGVVFCCFNQAYKITPGLFARWMRILAAVPGSVLWLWGRDGPVRTNLAREATARGIDPARLVFAPSLPLEDHLARLQQADLFLDTAPYNAHTTATDALRAGVPLLTVPGRSFASRVAATLVTAAGVPEMICASWDEYESRAIALAQSPAALAALRARLAGRADAPLFDPVRYIRHLESGLAAAADYSRRGEMPADIVVTAEG
jgi:predicted O-linked N-acetylglucosamine transferase (SPINDLY family)